jgi:putative Mn2+ efflux pump MntP
VGEWLVVVVWGLVSLVLVALGFVITKLLPKLSPQRATA